MKISMVSNRVGIGLLVTLSVAVLLILVMNHATPAIAQVTTTAMVSNLDQPSSARRTTLMGDQKYAQSFCTGSVAATLDKVRIYTLSNETDPNAMFYRYDPAPVVTIRSTDPWGKPGAVLHTLTNPVIDGSIDTAEDFTSSGYELAATTTYAVVIHRPTASGHIAFLSTTSPSEDTETQLGWAIGDQYMYDAGFGWTDDSHEGLVMQMAIYASGDLPATSTPAFTDSDCDGTAGSFDFSVDENSAEHTIVGVAAAGDADGDSLTYSVSGTDAAKFNNVFNLNASTGEITVKSGANIDYESSDKSYSITIGVTDGEDASGEAESPPTIDATTSVTINVNNVDEPGIVTLSTTAPRVGSALTATLSDPDSSVLVYTVQWARAANADAPFIDIPIDPVYMSNPTYTPTAADQGKYLKITMFYVERTCGEVSSFDDRCRREATKTLTTLVANEEGLIVQSQRVNRPATGQPLITGTPPAGYYWFGWLSLYANRNNVRDPDGMSGPFSYQWVRVDPNTLAEEDTQNPETPGWWWTYVPQTADLGKGLKVRVSFVDNEGNRESRTSPLISVPRPPSNAATGAPTINGTPSVGEPLTTSTSGISDAEGLFWVSYSYQWLADDVEISDATGRRYTVAAADGGKAIKVRVTFNDDAGNIESLTSNAVAVPASIPLTTPLTATIHDEPESHDGSAAFTFELRFSEEPAGSFGYLTLQQHALTVAGGTLPKVRRLEAGKNLKWEITVQPSSNADVTITLPVTTDCAAQGAICTVANKMLSSALEFTVSGPGPSTQQQTVLQENSPATGVPTINGTAQVGETLTASTSSIADADGVANATFTYQWLADDTDISGAATSTYTLVAGDVGKAIKVKVSFTDDGGNAETLTSAATAAVTLTGGTTDSLERSDQEDVKENSAATGAPTINGTAQVGESLTASTSGIADADGLTNATYTYQWLADDTEIDDATGSTYTVTDADAGKAIKVRVSFTDDAGNAETLTSNAVVASPPVVVPDPMTATTHDAPESHDGATAFTFELRFSEEPASGFSYTTVRDHAFTVTDGSLNNVRRLEAGKNVKWEITVTPSSDEDVTIALNATTDCSAEGAICTSDGGKLSGSLELVVPGPPSNSAATGAPTIGGTAQVGEILTASTSDISDSDGVANATFTYQWLADDTAISGATTSSYTLVAGDVGKAIKVRVTFTDDAGNAETLTSAATSAVAKPPLTATVHNKPSSHDGSAAFTFELRFSENIESFSYSTLQNHSLTVTGGTLPNVRRLEAGKNVRWEITVQPSSNADVNIVLPTTTDCSVQGAICTSDGRKLSGPVELTISGPGG